MKGGNVKLGSLDAGPGRPSEMLAYVTLPASEIPRGAQDAVTRIAQAAGLDPALSRGFTQIGPAVIGVLVSAGLIILYLAFRFGIGVGGFAAGLRFGISAVGALLHDILVVFGSAAILGYLIGWEVSALFVTAMLTMIGFSVHDTIVIFDRIRENLHHPLPDEDFGNLVNRSITQSFARSINTSLTVIVTLLILVFYGTVTPDLRFFVAAMLIGIVSGTYSSIYNASPILYLWDRAIARKRPEQALVELARADLRRRAILQPEAAAAAPQAAASSGRSYGQVRRRANAPARRGIEIDEDAR